MMNFPDKSLKELFDLANKIGNKRYHKLTPQDFENYRKFDYWRYINGDYECGTTQESKDWVKAHSSWYCPICGDRYSEKGGKTVDHKLPRSQYPWLSIEFQNLWVICQVCNQEKSEMHWYEYEHYVFVRYPHLYISVKAARPSSLLQSLKD
ncbi:MAG: HNH endonuclease signature motif containing protein [Nostoc sp. ChiSLP02]|nr:HNH endonuclease signature motif containing protein [Nostoc sp. DedSLP05]MDZ8098144.1 HNH endonuclease signature motif containing protein [Nostoc sp. DedSLP01]MDZ8184041.1 HNH endonuclease signature motif containing protein [Nostoc sp. ChiSLP02]